MTPATEADWLGADHEIVQRTRRAERAGATAQEHRVVGPPGCGKTTYLARQAPIAADKYGSDAVLLASLTRAAALEIAGRDTPIPKHMIGTLHAHCYRALDRPSLAETPDGVKAWNDHVNAQGWHPRFLMEDKQQADGLDYAPAEFSSMKQDGGGDALRSKLALYRARMTSPELYDPALAEFHARWGEFKADSGRLDFTDLIERCISRKVGAPGDPAVIMLDECQDLSRLELTLARQWAAGCEQIVLVGDPAQALYTWRGASPDALFDGEAASERVLEQSYRVPRAVHAYAVDWIRRMPGYREFKYRPTDEPGEVRSLVDPEYTWAHPDALLPQLTEDAKDGTVMVLASCGYMLAPLIGQLRARGIPFSNPWRPSHGGWNPMRGTERLLAFLHPDKVTWGDRAAPWTYGDVRRWMDPLKAKGLLSRGAKTWLEAKNLVDRFGESAEEQPIPLSQLVGLFASEDDADRAVSMDVDWWYRQHLEPRRQASSFAVRVYNEHGGRRLTTPPQIFLGTVHSFKGSEATHCYLFPDLSHAAYVTGRPHETRGLLPSASTYRTFYVAMTRAKRRLTVLPASGTEYVHLPHPNGGSK